MYFITLNLFWTAISIYISITEFRCTFCADEDVRSDRSRTCAIAYRSRILHERNAFQSKIPWKCWFQLIAPAKTGVQINIRNHSIILINLNMKKKRKKNKQIVRLWSSSTLESHWIVFFCSPVTWVRETACALWVADFSMMIGCRERVQ